MLVWNSTVPLSWGLLKYNHFGGQQLNWSQFYPTFPWFSDLTSCREGLAFAGGSTETTSCPESSWMWLCAEVSFSKDQGCGVELKSWGRRKSLPSLLPQWPCKDGWGCSVPALLTLRLQQGPRHCWAARKVLCLIPVRIDFWIYLCFDQSCVHFAALLVLVALSCQLYRNISQLVTLCCLPGRQASSQSAAAKKQSFCFYQQFWMDGTCVIILKRKK